MNWKKRWTRVAAILAVPAMVGVAVASFYLGKNATQFFDWFFRSPLVPIVIFGAIIPSAFALVSYLNGRFGFSFVFADQQDRGVEGRIDAAETRMRELIDARLKTVAQEKLDVDPTLRKLLNERIDTGILLTADEILRDRIRGEARIIRSLEFMERVTLELKTRLEGPGRRAEIDAAWARLGAYAMAMTGLAVAGYRVYSLGDISGRLMTLAAAVGDKPLWPMIAAQAAPYVGFVLLAEFTALLFLRFSNQSTALQRYFTEGLAQLRDRHLAMRFVVEFGSPDEIVVAAKTMIDASNRELKFLDDARKDEGLLTKAATSLKEKATSPRRGKATTKPSAEVESA